ncbi:tetratricopeptide repeat protein [Aestuariivirga sp.]|uniref:tetratricopeptide repeat protein n=1 Tax=Aestuariivirga sp. TaxID=2650926 RepID=UPI0039191FD9
MEKKNPTAFPFGTPDPLLLSAYSSLHDELKVAGSATGEIRHSTRPSIAVLPFENMSGDAEQSYFSDGITEDIITELQRFRSLFVMARHSSFSFRGQQLEVVDIGKKLGVNYVVEGSVRRFRDRIRISAQLIEVATGTHTWAERYDRAIDDIFAVQDEIARVVASTLSGRVSHDVAERAARKHPDSFAAYDYLLKGMQHHQRLTPEDNTRARELLGVALQVDPQYGEAYAWLAMTYMSEIPLTAEKLANAVHFAEKAVLCDEGNALCHISAGFSYLCQKRVEKSEFHHNLALKLNPNDPHVLTHMGYFLACTGRAQESLKWFDSALQLNPFPPAWYDEMRGVAVFVQERYDEAVLLLRDHTTWCAVYLASAYGHLGQIHEAAKYLEIVHSLTAGASLAEVARMEPLVRSEDMTRLLEGLRKAGGNV